MTRLVVVNHTAVLPPRSGGQQAVFGLCSELARHWPTELVWTQRKTRSTQQVELGDHHFVAQALPSGWLQRHVPRLLRRWLGAVDQDIGSLLCAGWNREFVDHLRTAIGDGDIVVLCHPWQWPALRPAIAGKQVLLVYDAHNVEHRLKAATWQASAPTRWLVDQVRRAEAEIVRRAELTLACTQRDADALQALAGVPANRLFVGSKGVPPSTTADAAAAARLAGDPLRTALFVGADHGPNNDAARWIVETLAPACPDWQFVIAGACGPAAGVAPRSANLRITGVVDDLSPLLAAAGVALNAVDAGSGINMKLFDYLQHGLPVVSTALGARGFEAHAEAGIVVAGRDGFAAALARLDAERALWQRLAAAGPALVRAEFAWPVVGARVAARIAALQRA